jgi:hypothetical protein
VDKFLFRVDNSAESFAAYRQDPAAFVLRWEETDGPRLPNGERTSAHAFTDPDLMAAQLAPDYPSFPEMLEAYVGKIRPHGRPEFGT